jgi:hypothetical protein
MPRKARNRRLRRRKPKAVEPELAVVWEYQPTPDTEVRILKAFKILLEPVLDAQRTRLAKTGRKPVS